MILLSAHKDTVMNNWPLKYDRGKFVGLLDNWVGVTTITTLLLTEPAIEVLVKKKILKLFYGDTEEWGTITSIPKVSKKDIVLVVDVCAGNRYKNIDLSLENISGFGNNKIREIKENLIWEGFGIKTKFYTGEHEDEDEGWAWKGKCKVISCIIPINDEKGTGFHQCDCTITLDSFKRSMNALKRLICYLIDCI